MTSLPRRYWHEMTSPDFAAMDAENVIAILQVAAVEQHGPHLPVSVDACINDGYMKAAVELMPDDLPATILPMCWVGKSLEHQQFPGTLTFSAETLRRMWMEIGDSVYRAGIRKMVFVNSHGGQPQVMDKAST